MSDGLRHAEVEELLGAYALNAVEEPERSLVDAHLEECPRCRAEVAGHREVAALLANTGERAPAGVWERIAGSLEASPPPMRLDLPGAVTTLDEARHDRAPDRRRPRSGTWGRTPMVAKVAALVAVAASVVIGFLGVQVVRQERLLDDMRATLSEDATLRAANLALASPDSTRTLLESPDGELRATAVVLPNGTGYLLAHDLPALDPARTYQLWGAAEDRVISLGVLGHQPEEVVAFQAGGPLDALVITEEEAPGVPRSEQPALLRGTA